MNSKGSSTSIGRIPRSDVNQFTSAFAHHGADASNNVGPAASHRVIHERESSLPITLVPGLSTRGAPQLRAGDDQLMSQPPRIVKS